MRLFWILFLLLIVSEEAHSKSHRQCINFLDHLALNPTIKHSTTSLFGIALPYSYVPHKSLSRNIRFRRKGLSASLDKLPGKAKLRYIHSGWFGSRDDLYVGFLESGHVYVASKGERFDGEALFGSSKFRQSEELTEGLVLKIKGSQQIQLEKMSKIFEKYGRPVDATCVGAVCQTIQDTTFLKHGNRDLFTIRPVTLLRLFLEGKVVDLSRNPVDVEIIMLGDKTPEDFLKSMRRSEIRRPILTFMAPIFIALGLTISS